jgi:hypothetical protein
MNNNTRFSRLIFLIAGIWGVIILAPGYFGEKMINAQYPPAITHPEYFYGFFGAALAWQIAFLAIAADPMRLRPLIPAAIVEKLAYAAAITVLFISGRVATLMVVFGAVDLLLGVLFIAAYFKLGRVEQTIAKAH